MSAQQKQHVFDLLKSIETGESQPIGYINPQKYIQHNLAAADGLAGFGATAHDDAHDAFMTLSP